MSRKQFVPEKIFLSREIEICLFRGLTVGKVFHRQQISRKSIIDGKKVWWLDSGGRPSLFVIFQALVNTWSTNCRKYLYVYQGFF